MASRASTEFNVWLQLWRTARRLLWSICWTRPMPICSPAPHRARSDVTHRTTADPTQTPLHIAARYDHSALCLFLISKAPTHPCAVRAVASITLMLARRLDPTAKRDEIECPCFSFKIASQCHFNLQHKSTLRDHVRCEIHRATVTRRRPCASCVSPPRWSPTPSFSRSGATWCCRPATCPRSSSFSATRCPH